jgi:hypothetical protein
VITGYHRGAGQAIAAQAALRSEAALRRAQVKSAPTRTAHP